PTANACRRTCISRRPSASGSCTARSSSRKTPCCRRTRTSSRSTSARWSSRRMRDLSLDQAAGLRRMTAPRPVKVVAITGGKGGVGKTLVAVNLGAALAQLGRSAMLFDADLGLANVDVLLGLHTRLNLEHVVSGECALEDVIV